MKNKLKVLALSSLLVLGIAAPASADAGARHYDYWSWGSHWDYRYEICNQYECYAYYNVRFGGVGPSASRMITHGGVHNR